MMKKLCPYLCTFLSLMAFLAIGCGKKADEEKTKIITNTNPQLSDIELELSKQELFCGGSDRTCPTYLTKVAVRYKDKLKICTGFLTDDDVVVTASSCLPEKLRMKDAACDKDVFFFFAELSDKPTRIGCAKVLDASTFTAKEPYLWRSDIAYLKLEKKIKRRQITASRTGLNDMDKLYSWSVDQIDDYQGIIRKAEDCQVIHNTYFNPLSTNASSPVITLAGCEYSEGNSGSPIIDYRGKVRGIISRPIDQSEIDEVVSMRILERPLKKMMHVSNYACAPIYPDQDVLNESECNKKLDITSFDLGQSDMINEANLFKNPVQKIEMSVNEKNRYVKLGVKLAPTDDGYEVQIEAKYYKNVTKWINEFTNNKPFTFNIELPIMKIRKSMNELGRIFASETVKVMQPTNFQFKPSLLKTAHKATLFMWSDGPTTTFNNLPEVCE